ncbi:hypothetical protein BCR36DRAFT_57225 [Piromyces finnis]|uniref:RRM domain-containing protein n=1 Tax=Piromyces finnis TaxID=1754191 RepID=A0A1Y1VB12_9FUNG|nr:hypothetical protein BCR36DRAFT_57225 [Piromyces finnis]|eukprot:ORX50254.1 hypothetical protein BCR36DRAFT_57225 [Piromyces finnis]
MTLNTYTYFKSSSMNDNNKNLASKFNSINASSSVNGLPSEEIKLFNGIDKNITRSSSVNVVGNITRSDAISRSDAIRKDAISASSSFLMKENDNNHWVPMTKWNNHLTQNYNPISSFDNSNNNGNILDNASVASSTNSIMGLNNTPDNNGNSKMSIGINAKSPALFQSNINNPLLDLNHNISEGNTNHSGNTSNSLFLNNQQTSTLSGSNSQTSYNFNLPIYSRERDFNILPSFQYHHPSTSSNNNNYYSEITRGNSMPISSTSFPTPPASPHNNLGNELYYLKNDLDLLIYTSKQKFNEINSFITQNNVKSELTDDLIILANQQLYLKGWYYHTDSIIKKMKSRLQTIFVFQDFGDDSINYSETGNLEYILYTFNLHIGICSDMRNEIQMGKPITLSNASNWWLSAKSLLYQIHNTFKLQNSFINKSNSQTSNISSMSGINRSLSSKRDDVLDVYTMKKDDILSTNNSMIINKNITDDLPKDNIMNNISRSNSCMPSLSSPTPSATSNNGPIQPSTNIYIRNLSSTTTDDSLYQMCKQYGTIVSAKAMVDIRTNECKGFGFVMYETEEQARKAIDALNKLKYYVSFARSGTPSSQESYSSRLKNLEDSTSMNIYISNLPIDVDEKQLLNLFKPHKVLSHRILRNEDGVSRGVGFARFSTRAAAQSVIDTYNNTMLPNSDHPLQVRFADSVAQKRLKSQIAIVNGNRHRSSSVSNSELKNAQSPPQQQPQIGQSIINSLI